MTLALTMVTIDTEDPVGLARWWAGHVGGVVRDASDGWFVTVELPDGPALAFQRTARVTAPSDRVHLDLRASDRRAAVSALQQAGASVIADHEHDGSRWTVLADPEGNRFCVAQADGQ